MRRTILLAGALALAAPAPAHACLNGVELEVEENASSAARSERLVRSGHLRRAFRLAGHALHELRNARSRRARNLRWRLKRVLAVATVRLDGQVDRRRWRTPRRVPAGRRTENLRWALAVLQRMARSSDDPVVRARHAEALVQLGRHRRAVRILQPLAENDLMPDAYGYAALARAQHALGDDEETDRALEACRAIVSRQRRAICPSLDRS
ncbi:MAG TPA: hypothetical protein RMH99_27025 [Sandaracinaceae bacterium LLY-WYZ-13_1]|nr:hypothetical protein [Sandaracinaceae bacterium LLY-WYZ-13_1]